MSIVNYLVTLLQSGAWATWPPTWRRTCCCACCRPFSSPARSRRWCPRRPSPATWAAARPRSISYPAAALGGFVLAVCSCTILPLFAGIYKKGAGLGPAITFLFVGPAINILALTYTRRGARHGHRHGAPGALGRLWHRHRPDHGDSLSRATTAAHDRETDSEPLPARPGSTGACLAVPAAAAGDADRRARCRWACSPTAMPSSPCRSGAWIVCQETLYRLVPFDATRGEEGVTAQGAILIGAAGADRPDAPGGA